MLRTAKLCGMKGLQTAKIVGLGDYVDLKDCVGTDAFVRPAAQMYRAAGFPVSATKLTACYCSTNGG